MGYTDKNAWIDSLDAFLSNIIAVWQRSGQEEYDRAGFLALCSNHFPHSDLQYMHAWQCLHEQALLRQGASGKWGLHANAWHHLAPAPSRITKSQAQDIVATLVARSQQWNTWAGEHHWPTIAAVLLWGSVARAETIDCGDVDVAIVWRRPPHQTQCMQNISMEPCAWSDALKNLSPTSHVWEIEEAVEEWLGNAPSVSLSGVDQWEELHALQPITAVLVCQDAYWVDEKNMGVGVKSHEAHALHAIMAVQAKHTHAISRRCVLK